MNVLPRLEHDSPEWLERRRSLLGASDVGAAIGFSQWTSPYRLWAEKTGRIPPREATRAMRMGQKLEPFVLDEWELATGLHAGDRGETFVHPDVRWASASPDAIAYEGPNSSDPLGIVEGKTDFNLWPDDEIPDQYVLQAQWQLWVTGLDRGWIALFAAGTRDFAIYEIERDERLITVAWNAAMEFWTHVVDDIEPAVDDSEHTAAALAEMLPTHVAGEVVELDDDRELADLALELPKVKEQAKAIAEREEFIKNTLKQRLGEAELATVAGRKVVSWKTQKNNRFEQTRHKEERPDCHAEFTPSGKTTRVFRVHE